MADPRIIAIELDERTILRRSDDIESERRVAIFDLLEHNHFAPARAHPDGYAGPYRVRLHVEEGRLAIEIAREDGSPLETVMLGLSRFRRAIKDYFAICDSYFRAVRQATAQTIEPIDMARRALHDEGSTLLLDCLKGKIDVDFATARRLFTLICVLHIRG